MYVDPKGQLWMLFLCLKTGSSTDLELVKWLGKLVGELRGLACLPAPAPGDKCCRLTQLLYVDLSDRTEVLMLVQQALY